MELTEDFNNILTDEEREKYVKDGDLDFGDDREARLDFVRRWCANYRAQMIATKKEDDKLFGE